MRAIEDQDAARFEKRVFGRLEVAEDVREVHPAAGIGVAEGDLAGMAVERGIHPYSNLLTRTEALWPPKPKLLLMATLTSRLAGDVGHAVQIALRVLVLDVDRRRHDAVLDGHDAGDQFDAAGGAEHVAGHRLGGADHQAVFHVIAEGELDGLGFRDVAEAGGGGVGVEVIDILRVFPAVAGAPSGWHRPGRCHRATAR